jgi:LmbE family N-acetylglucosaminyl deacetylase
VSALTERLGLPTDRPARVLVAAAHPDDAEIGAGGTILRLASERADVEVTWAILAAPDSGRAEEGRASAAALLARVSHRVVVGDLRDGYLPYLGTAPKDFLMSLQPVEPDLVLGPRREDAHQDHRLVAELLPQVFRTSTILEYEIPKWDGDLGPANLYVTLTSEQAAAKVEHLLAAFPSQAGRPWFTAATFEATLRLRGVECRAPDGLAEAFTCRKLSV